MPKPKYLFVLAIILTAAISFGGNYVDRVADDDGYVVSVTLKYVDLDIEEVMMIVGSLWDAYRAECDLDIKIYKKSESKNKVRNLNDFQGRTDETH